MGDHATVFIQKRNFIEKNNLIIIKEEKKQENNTHAVLMFYVHNNLFNRWMGYSAKRIDKNGNDLPLLGKAKGKLKLVK